MQYLPDTNPYPISVPEFEEVIALPPLARYQHFVFRAADWEEVFWLSSSQAGWFEINDSERRCIPLWPHPEFAIAFANSQLLPLQVKSLKIGQLGKQWLQKMQTDGIHVMIFPTARSEGIVVPPTTLLDDLLFTARENDLIESRAPEHRHPRR